MLLDLEKKFTVLRTEADKECVQSNGMVAKHVEELTIDINGKSSVDRSDLVELKQSRDALDAEYTSKSEQSLSNCRHIRDSADYMQGKISEYEVLLMDFADQKAYFMAEIEQLKAQLEVENQVDSLTSVQSDYKQACLEIQNQEA